MGCVLSSKLEKTSTQPGNDSIIAEVPAGAKNKPRARSDACIKGSSVYYRRIRVIDRTILLKFIKTLDSPPMGQCPFNLYNYFMSLIVKLQTAHANSSSKRIGKNSHKYISDLGFLVLRQKLSSKSFIKVIIAIIADAFFF